ncbi:MAG: winged helix DNA-binding domain-containing protein [Gammaproteobacteria bacterium]|nr:winged helix DNA-binding domain-containing protein [Gammaproteobacteria bacterium]MBU2676600.1 winged helix DNA-binding domain-containing protein [Gammaproteobacteria bacterium]NNL50335.1 winged helix-turn-helix domain-containing protein [Woeseiaceae bacterium]
MARRRVSLTASEARRIALAAQGFDRERPRSATDARHFRRAMRAVGVLQLDFVNVLVPAHFLVMWSRLGAYDRTRFERFLYESGEFIEQWAHEASVVPASDWPLLDHRRQVYQPWKNSPLNGLSDRDRYLGEVLSRVRREGPLISSDLPRVEGPKRKAGDWHRSMPRWALEYHFGRGDLAVKRRLPNFQRVYDLPERVISEQHRETQVKKSQATRALLRQSARALGLATLQDLADYYRMSPRAAAPRIQELVEQGELSAVDVEGWREPAFLSRSARLPRSIGGASLLSPFDPIAWCRPRAERLFNFKYRIEIYVPQAKRRWGYYVLPFRLGDRLVARVDLKADRQSSTLLVQTAYPEPGIDEEATVAALAEELRALGLWLGLEKIRVVSRSLFSRSVARAVVAY